jgi:hypothetical protein
MTVGADLVERVRARHAEVDVGGDGEAVDTGAFH